MVAGVGRQYGQRKISFTKGKKSNITLKTNSKKKLTDMHNWKLASEIAPNCGKIAARLPRFGTCFRGFVDRSRVFWHSAHHKTG
jgi:hypothetical protein